MIALEVRNKFQIQVDVAEIFVAFSLLLMGWDGRAKWNVAAYRQEDQYRVVTIWGGKRKGKTPRLKSLRTIEFSVPVRGPLFKIISISCHDRLNLTPSCD
jgi:hypothetical protein